MKKLNKKLSVTMLAIALTSTVAFANNIVEKPEGYTPSWRAAFDNAPIQKFGASKSDEISNDDRLLKTVRSGDLIWTQNSDAPRKEIEDNLRKQKEKEDFVKRAAFDAQQPSWSTSLWGKAKLLFAVTVTVTSWFKSLIA